MESWLTIIIRLVVVGLVAVVVGTVLQSTSKQLVAKLFNESAAPAHERDVPTGSPLSGSFVAVAGGVVTFVLIYGGLHFVAFRQFSNSVDAVEELGGVVSFVPTHQSRLLSYLYSEATVDLSGSGVDEGRFPELASLSRLRTLRVDSTEIADVATSKIGKCKTLKALDLSNTKVGDSALKQLVKLRLLNILIVNNTPVTNDSIATVLSLENLRKLECGNTGISPSGVAEIQGQAPELEIQIS